MALWTDVIDSATLTGYVREALADIERRKGSLARYLPNREVPDISVRFVAGQAGKARNGRNGRRRNAEKGHKNGILRAEIHVRQVIERQAFLHRLDCLAHAVLTRQQQWRIKAEPPVQQHAVENRVFLIGVDADDLGVH